MEPFGDPADTKVTQPVDSVEAIQTAGSAFQSFGVVSDPRTATANQ